jgi:hypothetical protein
MKKQTQPRNVTISYFGNDENGGRYNWTHTYTVGENGVNEIVIYTESMEVHIHYDNGGEEIHVGYPFVLKSNFPISK